MKEWSSVSTWDQPPPLVERKEGTRRQARGTQQRLPSRGTCHVRGDPDPPNGLWAKGSPQHTEETQEGTSLLTQ